MADNMGTARLAELTKLLRSDVEKWQQQRRLDDGMTTDLFWYVEQIELASADTEEQILDLAGRNATVLAPRRDFLVSRDLDAEAETLGRVDPGDEEEDERPEPPMAQVTDATRDPHLVYRRKGQQRPDWSA